MAPCSAGWRDNGGAFPRELSAAGLWWSSVVTVSAEAALIHRRWFGAARDLRPLSGTGLLDGIGGQPTVDRLVDLLYDRFESDPQLRPLFGRDLSTDRRNQKRFFTEWLGGRPVYSESAWSPLFARHDDLPITAWRAERWLDHLRGALEDAGVGQHQRLIILQRAQAVARALVNHDADPSRQPTTGAAGRSRHRSELVASCGVPARTVQRAVLLARGNKLAELAALAAEVPDLLGRPTFAARVLQVATIAGRIAVVDWLIDRGVNVHRPWALPTATSGLSLEGVLFVTPLCAAGMHGRGDVAARLRGAGAGDDLFTAAFLGELPLLGKLLGARPSLAQVADPATDAVTITPIHHAVAGEQLPALRLLLDHTEEPIRTGTRALRAATERGNGEMVALLLERGADGRAVGAGRWVLDAAIAPQLAAAGASAGVGLDGEESGDWVKASCTGNQRRRDDPAYVAALLRYGARVDQRYHGATALHYAVKAGFVGTIRLLLERGADIDALDDRGRTPRDWLRHAAPSVDIDAVRRALGAAAPTG